jgi:ABC-2 type transport system permease protein
VSAMVRMLWFHARLFGRNSYFFQLLVTSTLSVLALQLLAAHGTGAPASEPIWLRSAIVGMWTVSTVAAGMIGFQRFQGTLVHLVMTPGSPARTLLPLVGSAATFGLLTFPLAAVGASIFGFVPQIVSWSALVLGAGALWCACLAISTLVAAVFVLTPNAITYEGLLAVPLVLLSGVFGIPDSLPAALDALRYALPTTPAVRILVEQPSGAQLAGLVAACLGSTALWFVVSRVAMNGALARARVNGTLEVI